MEVITANFMFFNKVRRYKETYKDFCFYGRHYSKIYLYFNSLFKYSSTVFIFIIIGMSNDMMEPVAPPTKEELKDMEIGDRIDDFILDRMTKGEEAMFLSDCKIDPELRHRAYMTALLVKAIRRNEDKV